MNKDSKIYVAGHNGMVGSAILRELQKQGYKNIVTKNKKDLDLLNQKATSDFFTKEKPEFVFLAAARVGGIEANINQVADFTYENLQIQNNVIHNSYLHKVKRLISFGSACSYPRLTKQPIKEEYLLTGPLEPTNYGYAIAKIAGIKMCEAYRFQYGCDFVSIVPTNLYGINDNFSPKSSHVIPALIKRFHEAKISNQKNIEIWGSGNPRREFLYVDDLAKACIFIMNNKNIKDLINIGMGTDISIRDLAFLIKKITEFSGEIKFDTSKPDGMPKKMLDSSKINNLGWLAETSLEDGIKKTYDWYLKKPL
jgi:GDP-L-fucose synthase